jgi:YD repeat-containing protein
MKPAFYQNKKLMRPWVLLLSVFWGTSALGQDSANLPKPVDTTYYYFQSDTAPRYIPLETQVITQPSTPNTALQTSGFLISPPAVQMQGFIQAQIPTTAEPDRNKSVGEIAIQETVSATGALNYIVPIQIISGKPALPVNINMAYSSQSGAGFMGYGWSLSGLSLIQEVSSNIYYNTKTEPLKLTKAGQFVLDGMRLIKMSETTTQITYQSEQGFINAVATLSGNIIRYFTVNYPNGNKAVYGDENNYTQQLYYPLIRIEDLHGNRVAYTYTLRNEQYYISKIEYGGTATLPHYALVEFNYGARTDINTQYSAGKTILKDWQLNSIVCKSSGTMLRTYTLTYQYANNTALLQKIDCSSPAESFNPLQFYYGNGSTTAQLVKTSTQLTSWFANTTVSNLKVSKGKFDYGTDNDGLISYPNLNPYYEYFQGGTLLSHSQKEYINNFATNQALLVYQGLQSTMASPSVSITAGTGFINMFAADIDGKPGEELIKINNLKNGTLDRVEFRIYKANLYSGLALTNTYTFDLGELLTWYNTRSVHPKYFYSGDFNGDGKMEILAVACHNPLGNTSYLSKTYIFDVEAGIKRHESTGLNFKIDYAVTSGINDDILFPVDIDADGKTDIIHIHDNGTDIYTFDISGTTYTKRLIASNTNLKKSDIQYRQLSLGDLNADGLPDILVSPRESYYSNTYVTIPVYAPLYCSNGHAGTYEHGYCNICYVSMPSNNYCNSCYSSLSYGYNYDTGNYGYYTCPNHGTSVTQMLSTYVSNGNTWSVYYSKGNGLLDKKTLTFKNLEQNEKIILQDINKDNIADVISNKNGSIAVYLVNNGVISTSIAATSYTAGGNYVVSSYVGGDNFHSQLLSLNNGTVDKLAFTRDDGVQRLASGMVNSLGMVSKTEYKLINEGISQYGNSSNWFTQGYGAVFPYLNYQGPIAVVTQKEQWLKNVQVGGTAYQYNNALVHLQGLGFAGFEKVYTTNTLKAQTLTQTYDPLRYGILTKAESPVAIVNYTYNFSVATNRIANITLTQQTENNVLKGTTATHNYTYDSYGNIITEVNDFGAGLKATTTNTIINNTGTPYVLGAVVVKTIVKERGGASVTLKEVYTFDAKFKPLTKTATYNNNTTLMEEYSYDGFGNITQQKTKAYSAAAWLITQYQYDGAGRFITKKINPLSQSTDYVFAAATGTLTSEKDFKGNIITYEYDGWQRLKKVNNPDATVKNITWEWQPVGNDRLYSVKEEYTGKPTTKTHYDGLNRKLRTGVIGFDGAELLTDYVYDAQGRLIKTSLPYKTGSVLWNTTAYDVHDRPTTITEATGAATTITYSAISVTTVKNSVSTTQTTDAAGVVTSVTNPAGTISYTYKPDGQPAAITAPGAAVTTFSYDAWGRQTQITDPSAGTISYAYDVAGNCNKITDANAKSVSSTYDAYNRLITKTTPEFSSTYTYNTDGWIASISNNNGSSKSFTYDVLGRVTKTIETVGSENYQVDYTYAGGKIIKTVHLQPNYTINYLYNAYGYLYKLTNASNTALKTINKMTAFGQVEETLMGNGLLQTSSFNAYGLLTGIKTMNAATAVQNITYTIDNLKGNITARKDETRNLTESFTYDNLDRLTSYGTSGATKTIPTIMQQVIYLPSQT